MICPMCRLLGIGVLMAALLSIGGCGVLTDPPAASPSSSTAHQQRPYTVPPVQVVVVDRTAGDWQGLEGAVATWDLSPYVDMTLAPECGAAEYCVVVDADAYGRTKWVAQTTYLTPHVGYVELNTAIPGYDTYDVQSNVVAHELGHQLGLHHVPATVPTVMSVQSWGRNVAALPSFADLAQLERAAQQGVSEGALALRQPAA